MADKIILRNDTAENLANINPILECGEVAVESDTSKLKVGDGVKHWNDLAYMSGGSGGSNEIVLWEGELKEEDAYYEAAMTDSGSSNGGGSGGVEEEVKYQCITNIPFNVKLSKGDKLKIHFTGMERYKGSDSTTYHPKDYVLDYAVAEYQTDTISTDNGELELGMGMLELYGLMEITRANVPVGVTSNSFGISCDYYGVDKYILGSQVMVIYNGDEYLAQMENMGETITDDTRLMLKNGLQVTLSGTGGSIAGLSSGEISSKWWRYSGDNMHTQILKCNFSLSRELSGGYISGGVNISQAYDFDQPVVFKRVTLVKAGGV